MYEDAFLGWQAAGLSIGPYYGEQTKPGSLDIKAWHRALDKAKWQDDKAFRYLESQSLKNTERK